MTIQWEALKGLSSALLSLCSSLQASGACPVTLVFVGLLSHMVLRHCGNYLHYERAFLHFLDNLKGGKGKASHEWWFAKDGGRLVLVRLCLSDACSTTLTISANSHVCEFFALFFCTQKAELLGFG